jgi:hypothetical protein
MHAIFGTFFDGTVRQYRGGRRWEALPGLRGVSHAAVAGDGSLAYITPAEGNQFNLSSSRPPMKCLWVSLGPTRDTLAVVTPTRQLFLVNAKNPQGVLVNNPPGGIEFAKAFMSKNDGNEVLAIATNGRIFAIDANNIWSEIPNPRRVSYAGVNKDRIVGCVQGLSPQNNIYVKAVLPATTITDAFKESPYTFNDGRSAVPFTNKGLGQVLRECKESSTCVGVNYVQASGTGNFVMRPEGSNTPNNDTSYYKKKA